MPATARIATISAFLLLALGAANVPANADDKGALYVAPGPSTLLPVDAANHYKDQPGVAGRKLGDIIGSSLKSPTGPATDVLVTTECGHYKTATITYSDGVVKTMTLGNAPATKNDMERAKAAIPVLRIVDQAGCGN
jgi:hypothetical protein